MIKKLELEITGGSESLLAYKNKVHMGWFLKLMLSFFNCDNRRKKNTLENNCTNHLIK